MKTSIKSLALVTAFAFTHPAQAQDSISRTWNGNSETAAATSALQMEIAPSQWTTDGSEQMMLSGLTISVQKKIQRESAVSGSSSPGSKSRTSRHSRKNSDQEFVF